MIHLLFSMNADYHEKGSAYVASLEKNCNIAVTLFNVDCGPVGADFNQICVKTADFRGYSKEGRFMMQAGQFVDFFECDPDDIIIFTDADIRLQRPFSRAELDWLHGLKGFSAGANCAEGETLADEMPRLYPCDTGLLEREFPEYASRPIFNTGVVAAPCRVWKEMFERYVERYPLLFRCLQHYAAVQWLMCYCMGDVEQMPKTFHSHGHFGTPSGVTFKNGTALFSGEVIALNHRL